LGAAAASWKVIAIHVEPQIGTAKKNSAGVLIARSSPINDRRVAPMALCRRDPPIKKTAAEAAVSRIKTVPQKR
jgi:hypothetical protein